MITVLAGGVGAARLLRGLVLAVPAGRVTAVVNTADDVVLHGLHVSPDLDTVTYTLAEAGNPETGWGLAGETWQAMDALDRFGGPTWFRLGDRDLGTHLYRTGRLAEGAGLAAVTAEIAQAWGLEATLLPMTEDPVATMVTLDEGEGAGDEVGFQEYFVRLGHSVAVRSVRFAGADAARPGPGVVEALADAEAVIIAPSNPVVSIDPLLAVPGIADALRARREGVEGSSRPPTARVGPRGLGGRGGPPLPGPGGHAGRGPCRRGSGRRRGGRGRGLCGD